MKFIPPLEIASKIMTLIVEAEKELILVSPYVNINYWEKMKRSLQIALSKEVDLHFIIRENADNEINALKNLGIYPIKIKDLHAKVYINDKYAIVTSQNIIEYSDINSIDVGYVTETEDERIELINYVNTYISKVKYSKAIPEVKTEAIIEQPIIKENRIEILEREDTDQTINILPQNLEKVIYRFKEKYRNHKFTSTSTYLFCDSLIQFGYFIMVENKYTVKINLEIYDNFNFMEALKYLPLNLNHSFKIEIYKRSAKAIYVNFVPINKALDFEALIQDYLILTDLLINDEVLRKIKLKTNNLIL